jgi:GMP synthase (glutamine-hydrolysing)
MRTPFLILQTGQPTPSMRRYGSFAHWIRVAAGLERDAAVVVDVEAGAALPQRAGFAGVIVTGSAAMVTERRDWSERSAEWLHRAAHAGMPLLGICYGHQLLAHALGGEADWHPEGIEIGTVAVRKTPAAIADPLFAELPDVFHAQAVHRQTAVRLPPGAECLARNDFEPHHAFRFGEAAWGVQFHPEFDAFAMRGYIRHLADALRNDGADPDAIARTVTDTPAAAAILARFGRFVMERSARPMA